MEENRWGWRVERDSNPFYVECLSGESGNRPLDQSQESGVASPRNHDAVRSGTPAYAALRAPTFRSQTVLILSRSKA
jgi:hypothetical protein